MVKSKRSKRKKKKTGREKGCDAAAVSEVIHEEKTPDAEKSRDKRKQIVSEPNDESSSSAKRPRQGMSK